MGRGRGLHPRPHKGMEGFDGGENRTRDDTGPRFGSGHLH
jgi:hypothetical protein